MVRYKIRTRTPEIRCRCFVFNGTRVGRTLYFAWAVFQKLIRILQPLNVPHFFADASFGVLQVAIELFFAALLFGCQLAPLRTLQRSDLALDVTPDHREAALDRLFRFAHLPQEELVFPAVMVDVVEEVAGEDNDDDEKDERRDQVESFVTDTGHSEDECRARDRELDLGRRRRSDVAEFRLCPEDVLARREEAVVAVEPFAFLFGGNAVARRLARRKILRVDDDRRIAILRLAADIEDFVVRHRARNRRHVRRRQLGDAVLSYLLFGIGEVDILCVGLRCGNMAKESASQKEEDGEGAAGELSRPIVTSCCISVRTGVETAVFLLIAL